MSVELVHSSVPRDLDGQQGFGVAAMTRDLPRALRDELVARSDGSELAGGAHRVVSYVVCQSGGAAWPVLTAVTLKMRIRHQQRLGRCRACTHSDR